MFVKFYGNLRLRRGQIAQLLPDLGKILRLCSYGRFNGCHPGQARLQAFGEGASLLAELRQFLHRAGDIRQTRLNGGKRFSRGPLQFLDSLAQEQRQVFRDATGGA